MKKCTGRNSEGQALAEKFGAGAASQSFVSIFYETRGYGSRQRSKAHWLQRLEAAKIAAL